MLRQSGKKVCLATGTGAHPAWLARKWCAYPAPTHGLAVVEQEQVRGVVTVSLDRLQAARPAVGGADTRVGAHGPRPTRHRPREVGGGVPGVILAAAVTG